MSVFRVYAEKKAPFDIEATGLFNEIKSFLGIFGITKLRILNRYDVEGMEADMLMHCLPIVFSEPQVDNVYFDLPEADYIIASEYLPGQFDQRASSCADCLQLVSCMERPTVKTAKIYLIDGDIKEKDILALKAYLINPVESREAALDKPCVLAPSFLPPQPVAVLNGFRELKENELSEYISAMGLAMDEADLELCIAYFISEGRDPSITEIRVLDTYWSDHCRHTTFNTELSSIDIKDEEVFSAFNRYLAVRKKLGREDRAICLMDLATIAAKELKAQGKLFNLDESEEINACSVRIKADNNGVKEDWLLMFKNETHNHPTEIEPFGGAATCIGGAIRDPLSGRSYVYQAMRVTGAANPLAPISETLVGKLPQRKIVTEAAAGYSSYGNQIGVATGLVDEIYHPGYLAKRMEVGAVIAAAPASNVIRSEPVPGDLVVLIGGKTGRDGCGGATGSSKSHDLSSLESCGAEVQKGNAPEERKIQRLFRNPDASRLIKRCNDFGAGGVSVAIGELAAGLDIYLDNIPKKYEGLDGTELAISESQERMAAVISPSDLDAFLKLAAYENLEATVVAEVTDLRRLKMTFMGQTVVNLSREFLDTNGASKTAKAFVPEMTRELSASGIKSNKDSFRELVLSVVSDLNVCSKKGLAERFDSSIGSGTVLAPYGGKYQLTPCQAMVSKIPVLGETECCSGMAWGFDPYLSEANPYRGAYLAVLESVSKLVAAGFSRKSVYLSFQEYFERLRNEDIRWGKPLAALLGAFSAQLDLEVAAIGGKDSMSGSFEDIDVPPTLISFAVGTGITSDIISPEFKKPGSAVCLITADPFDTEALISALDRCEEYIKNGSVISAYVCGSGGILEAIVKMAVGNRIGFSFSEGLSLNSLAEPCSFAVVLELKEDALLPDALLLGHTQNEFEISLGSDVVSLHDVQNAWESVLEPIFPYLKNDKKKNICGKAVSKECGAAPLVKISKPRAIIPVFPGTNCEYDTIAALERAGAEAEILIIKNLKPSDISETVLHMQKAISRSQMIVFPGGFSGGDEPDGSGKLINAFFRNPAVTDAVHELLYNRDGLILGICNGFQALIKLGLVPYGRIVKLDEKSPTLTFNTVGRHKSLLCNTRISSKLSPWLSRCELDEIYTMPISHGEGRFVCPPEVLAELNRNGQIATQYADFDGNPTIDPRFNPNGSLMAVESISSPDGRVLGKMCHSERSGDRLYINVPGNKMQPIFESGVDYFRL